MRKEFIFLLLFFCLLAGCSHHYDPLELAKKKRLVSELISSSPKCSLYKDELKSLSIDDDGVDSIYHEALKAHCINKDV